MGEVGHTSLAWIAHLAGSFAALGLLAFAARAQVPEAILPDLRPVYEAIEAGALEAAEAEIARLRNNFAGWEPPPELRRLLAVAYAERGLGTAKRTGDAAALIAAGERYPEVFRCPRVDLAWPLAEAYVAEDRLGDARAVYRRLIAGCPDADDRLATLYRALEDLPAEMLPSLIALEKGRPHAPATEGVLALFELRAARRGVPVDVPLVIDTLSRAPEAVSDPAAMLELGWALRDLGRPAEALAAFERAADAGAGDEARRAAAEIAGALGFHERARRALEGLAEPATGAAALEGLLAGRLAANAPRDPDLFALAERVADASQAPALEGLLAVAHGLAGDPERGRRRLARARAEAAAGTGDMMAGDRLAGAAWRLLDAGELELAAGIFALAADIGASRADEGQVRALIAAGDLEGAQAAAAAIDPARSAEAARIWLDLARFAVAKGDRPLARSIVARLETVPEIAADAPALLGDIALAEGYAAYEAGRYEESAARADEAQSLGREDAALLLGWSRYQAGDASGAAEAFASALEGEGRAEAVEGLALAAQGLNSGDRARYAALAPEIAAAIASRSGEAAFYRDQMYLARARGAALPALAGLEPGWLQSGLAFRHTKGAPGVDRFTMFSPYLAGRIVAGANHVTAVLELPVIKAGRAPPAPAEGEVPPGRVGPKRETVLVPTLSWVREGESFDLLAGLSTTPIGGEISALPTFDFGLVRHLEGGGRVDFALRGQSRVDSLLSYVGSNAGFGRVVEYGASAQIRQPLGRWTINAGMHASLLDGEDVEDNSRVGGNIGLMYGLKLKGFDYFSIGPSLTLDHYDENLDFFTFGNGGYFSPQFFALGAIVAAFQSEEARNVVLRGVMLAGGEVIRRDAGFDNPFDRSSSRLPARDASGPVATFRFESVYRLSPHWALVGDFASAFTNDFTEYRAGFALRFSFGARPALTSADIFLPRQGFSQR